MVDAIYFAKDIWSLWRVGDEAAWRQSSDAAFAGGDVSSLTMKTAFVVHPQLGK